MSNILILGNGAREHALAEKFAQSNDNIIVAPGNDGIHKQFQTFQINPDNTFQSIYDITQKNNIDFVFVGSEQFLADGVVDFLSQNGIHAIGPTKAAAQIETSKSFAKKLMIDNGIPTAKYQSFTERDSALAYINNIDFPIVIKADGLAAGKGVTIANDRYEATTAITEMLAEHKYGTASSTIVIEDFLQGEEASIFAFCDGENFVSTIFAQDHKQAEDNDKGPNTGGMGAFAAVDKFHHLHSQVDQQIFTPTLAAMKALGCPFSGVLYAGLMIKDDTAKVIEFNCRFGDPETQVVLPLLKNSLTDICQSIINKKISEITLQWEPQYAVNIVLASKGYPADFEKGHPVNIDNSIFTDERLHLYFSGIKYDPQTQTYTTNGGRVLGLTALGNSLDTAIDYAYQKLPLIQSPNLRFRTDIGRRKRT